MIQRAAHNIVANVDMPVRKDSCVKMDSVPAQKEKTFVAISASQRMQPAFTVAFVTIHVQIPTFAQVGSVQKPALESSRPYVKAVV